MPISPRGETALWRSVVHRALVDSLAKIKAKHPDILERRPEGLYRFLVGGEDQRQALFDYLACDRVAAAWARKRPAKDKDLARKQQAEGRWLR